MGRRGTAGHADRRGAVNRGADSGYMQHGKRRGHDYPGVGAAGAMVTAAAASWTAGAWAGVAVIVRRRCRPAVMGMRRQMFRHHGGAMLGPARRRHAVRVGLHGQPGDQRGKQVVDDMGGARHAVNHR